MQDNVVISRNGLHYAYYRDDGINYDIYIDNKLVNNTVPDSETFTLDGVSNDGLHFAYNLNDVTTNDDNLYKDGSQTPFLQPKGIFDAPNGSYTSTFFSSDLSRYVGFFTPDDNGNGNPVNSIILNGTTSGPTFTGNPQTIGISENGSHYYAVIANGTGATASYQLVIDGKTITTLDNSNDAGVNDAGQYYYISNSKPALIIGTKTVGLPAANFNGNELGYEYAAVNSDGSHYAVGDSDKTYWMADGNQISVTGDVYNIEMVGNTLYVYRWSN